MSLLSIYCQTTCKAACCKRGKLPLSSEEIRLFDKKRIDQKNHYDLKEGCEHLKDSSCSIYFERPNMCREYPFHHFGPKKIAITLCAAVTEGLLDEEIKIKKATKL